MYIIETCPECGGDLEMLVLTSNPPIPARRCKRCGWYWQGKMIMPVRVPFKPPKEEGGMSMGVYGNGMEMTSNCAECPLNHDAEMDGEQDV